jgi:hypothetical protein
MADPNGGKLFSKCRRLPEVPAQHELRDRPRTG